VRSMKYDARGLPVSTSSDEVIDAIDRFTVAFLAAKDAASTILAIADTHPDCALVNAYAAALHLYSQSAAAIERDALPLLARARTAGTPLSMREQLLIDAVAAWARNDFGQAIALHEVIAEGWPADIVSAKFAEFLFFQAPDYQRHLRFMEMVAPANDTISHFKAMHAFAYELCGQYPRAEAVARSALDLDLDTPWAHHALAHLYLNQGRIRDGTEALERFAPTWVGHGQSLRVHNTWHLALLHLAALDINKVIDLYRTRIAGLTPTDVFEHVDAISLLWRLELAGHRQEEEWRVLVPHIVPRANEQVFPFLNAHYVYALARGGRVSEAEHAVELVRAFADRQHGDSAHTWGCVGVPLLEACLAFARGDSTGAAQLLGPVQRELYRVGGSDAQNDLFRQTYLVSLLDTRQASVASRLLADRIGRRLPTPLEAYWLSRV
jgi:tetratricopeptide (TPR) repeat protein